MKKRKFILPVTAFALLLSLGLAACNNSGGKSDQQGGEQQESGYWENKFTFFHSQIYPFIIFLLGLIDTHTKNDG